MNPSTAVVQRLFEPLDRAALVALAEQARGPEPPPSFSGRCLDPAYLRAVAAGAWSPADADRLAACRRSNEEIVRRVGRRHRRRLRAALQATTLAVLTGHLPQAEWQQRRAGLAGPWQPVVGPLPLAALLPLPRGPVD